MDVENRIEFKVEFVVSSSSYWDSLFVEYIGSKYICYWGAF